MSSQEPITKLKRARQPRAVSTSTSSRRREPTPAISAATSEQRHAMIAELAYRRAEQRGFAGGDPVADWLASEKEVDALLSGGAH